MYIFYDDKTDYLEVLEKKCETISTPQKNGMFKIFSKKNKKLVGWGIESVSERMADLKMFDPFVKISILIKISRIKHKYTQQEIAKKLKIGLLPYQRLESGENNPTLKTLIHVKEVLPDIDLSLVA